MAMNIVGLPTKTLSEVFLHRHPQLFAPLFDTTKSTHPSMYPPYNQSSNRALSCILPTADKPRTLRNINKNHNYYHKKPFTSQNWPLHTQAPRSRNQKRNTIHPFDKFYLGEAGRTAVGWEDGGMLPEHE